MSSDAVKDFVAGTFGGMALVVTGHPFDTLKVRLQTAPPGHFSSFTDCVKQTFAKEGVSAPLGKKKDRNPDAGVAAAAVGRLRAFTRAWGRPWLACRPSTRFSSSRGAEHSGTPLPPVAVVVVVVAQN